MDKRLNIYKSKQGEGIKGMTYFNCIGCKGPEGGLCDKRSHSGATCRRPALLDQREGLRSPAGHGGAEWCTRARPPTYAWRCERIGCRRWERAGNLPPNLKVDCRSESRPRIDQYHCQCTSRLSVTLTQLCITLYYIF